MKTAFGIRRGGQDGERQNQAAVIGFSTQQWIVEMDNFLLVSLLQPSLVALYPGQDNSKPPF